METVQSRRQDQTGIQDIWKYLTHYRELAIRDRNGQFAAVATQILDRVAADPASFATSGYSVGEFLAEALAYPDITAALPTSTPVPTTYTKTSKGSQLVSLRRGSTTAVVFGGTDWHNKRVDSEGQSTSIREIASGLSTNPTFFKLRKGARDPGLRPAVPALLQHRPLPQRRGDRRARWLAAERRGGGRVPPAAAAAAPALGRRVRARLGGALLLEDGLPAPARRTRRCWRRRSLITEVGNGGFDLAFDLDGPPTSLTIELCFRSGGTLAGVVPASGDGNFQLVEGEGSYTVGGDTITFGPGTGSGIRQPIAMDPGEKYTYLGGNLTPSGQRVYLTGLVPFRYTLRLR